MSRYPHLLSPLQIGPVTVRNRIMQTAHVKLFTLDGIKSSFATLNACYAKAGVSDRCRTSIYDSPHQFNLEMQAEAWSWLAKFV